MRATHRFFLAAFAALLMLSLSGCATRRWNNGSSYSPNSYGTTRSRTERHRYHSGGSGGGGHHHHGGGGHHDGDGGHHHHHDR